MRNLFFCVILGLPSSMASAEPIQVVNLDTIVSMTVDGTLKQINDLHKQDVRLKTFRFGDKQFTIREVKREPLDQGHYDAHIRVEGGQWHETFPSTPVIGVAYTTEKLYVITAHHVMTYREESDDFMSEFAVRYRIVPPVTLDWEREWYKRSYDSTFPFCGEGWQTVGYISWLDDPIDGGWRVLLEPSSTNDLQWGVPKIVGEGRTKRILSHDKSTDTVMECRLVDSTCRIVK